MKDRLGPGFLLSLQRLRKMRIVLTRRDRARIAFRSWSPHFWRLRYRRRVPDWQEREERYPRPNGKRKTRHEMMVVKRHCSIVLKQNCVVKRIRHAGKRKPCIHEEQPR